MTDTIDAINAPNTLVKNYKTFIIIDTKVKVISDDTAYGRNTVAEIDNYLHYLADEPDGISAAIFAYQEVNKVELTNDQLKQVFRDNNITSSAI